jgi:hypothetical protein
MELMKVKKLTYKDRQEHGCEACISATKCVLEFLKYSGKYLNKEIWKGI